MSISNADSRRALRALKKRYAEYPIVICTGAGVSMANKGSSFGLPNWSGLLKRILAEARDWDACPSSFQLPADPWDAADVVVKKCPGKRKSNRVKSFQDALFRIVQHRGNFPGGEPDESGNQDQGQKKRQLRGNFLREADSLNAVVAFAGLITGRVYLPHKSSARQSDRVYLEVAPNPRIRAIVTYNYDPFIEAASSSKFREPFLKPVAAYGSDAGSLTRIPVFHIHGYVPHPDQRARGKTTPLVEELVLTKESYEKAWFNVAGSYDQARSARTVAPSMTPQFHYLRRYVTLFIGFSFSDKMVLSLLRQIRRENAKSESSMNRRHFALLCERDFPQRDMSKSQRFFEEIGVSPIFYDDHPKIPDILGDIYAAGLKKDHGKGPVKLPNVESSGGPRAKGRTVISMSRYWHILLKSRDAYVTTKEFEARPE